MECFMCSQNTSRYMKILGEYICEACEKEIANLEMEDKRYEYYNIMMKKIWKKFLTDM